MSERISWSDSGCVTERENARSYDQVEYNTRQISLKLHNSKFNTKSAVSLFQTSDRIGLIIYNTIHLILGK